MFHNRFAKVLLDNLAPCRFGHIKSNPSAIKFLRGAVIKQFVHSHLVSLSYMFSSQAILDTCPQPHALADSQKLRFCSRLSWVVSTTENQFISPMLIQTAFNFSSVVQRLVCRFSGLRLLVLRRFPAFLASGPCVVSASSYRFRSAAPPRLRSAFSQLAPVAKFKLPVLASGSNIPVKPTRILRSAYLAR